MESERVTLRPWIGECATTGFTMDDFLERLKYCEELPYWVTRAAVSICRSYAITGLGDVAYIANVIHSASGGGMMEKDSTDFGEVVLVEFDGKFEVTFQDKEGRLFPIRVSETVSKFLLQGFLALDDDGYGKIEHFSLGGGRWRYHI